ncbi:helix-turn-helix transcriptional regulator [Frigidibacter sp. RF13]|uniref:AraC family transcriptional regulator n=1 Tax=Frigidibacter sp. RF13 TaxID=2997340 RepID=UPI0022705F54|nr:helix-turn-helix transcriptional regulator [Frigidibacter sp. RF13]MCY1126126.1 helix-turn-helix transcriptional regulator [Frigidibacter sp. RF13]
MSKPRADAIAQEFPAAPRERFVMDRHYLLCTVKGVLKMEAEGREWSLPPARAALIRAGVPVDCTLPQPVAAASVLFDEGFIPAPERGLAVFDLSPLARSLVREARRLGGAEGPGEGYAGAIFSALGAVALDLALTPSPAWISSPRTPALRRALDLTSAALEGRPSATEIAAAAGLSPRSLARHCADELGLTWRAALRRIRMIRAMELLASEPMGVAETAFATGYDSVSSFTEAFRDFAGCSPRVYRARFDELGDA